MPPFLKHVANSGSYFYLHFVRYTWLCHEWVIFNTNILALCRINVLYEITSSRGNIIFFRSRNIQILSHFSWNTNIYIYTVERFIRTYKLKSHRHANRVTPFPGGASRNSAQTIESYFMGIRRDIASRLIFFPRSFARGSRDREQ